MEFTPPTNMQKLAERLKVLAEPKRLLIVKRLEMLVELGEQVYGHGRKVMAEQMEVAYAAD